MFWARDDFDARSCCDLGLHSRNPNVARDMLSQYGDYSCEISVKFDFKSQSYVPETILLKRSCCDLEGPKCCTRHVVSTW